jgi:phage terminase Nu1 subunit (DNA packaging protein)
MSEAKPTYPCKVIARLLKLSERHVRNLVKDGVIPAPEKGGRYDLIGSVQGYVVYLRERTMGRELSQTDAHAEKTRLLKAQADRTELEVDELKGLMIPAEDVAGEWQEMVSNARARMLAMPSKAAHLLIAAESFTEAEQILENEIHGVLNELANDGLPPRSGKKAKRKGVDAAAKTNDKPVGRRASKAVA